MNVIFCKGRIHLSVCLYSVFPLRDMYHGIGPLDPERLNVFRTVKEITGEIDAAAESPWKKLLNKTTALRGVLERVCGWIM